MPSNKHDTATLIARCLKVMDAVGDQLSLSITSGINVDRLRSNLRGWLKANAKPPAPPEARCREVNGVWTHDGGCVPWSRKCDTTPPDEAKRSPH